MSRQVRRRRLRVEAEVHDDPQRWLRRVFDREVTAVVRDQHARWGVVLDHEELVWLGGEWEIRAHDLLLWRLYRAGVRPEGWRPPYWPTFGRNTFGALRRVYNLQRAEDPPRPGGTPSG
jgi:hypothetical protein